MDGRLYEFLKEKGYEFCYSAKKPFLAGPGEVSITHVEEFIKILDGVGSPKRRGRVCTKEEGPCTCDKYGESKNDCLYFKTSNK